METWAGHNETSSSRAVDVALMYRDETLASQAPQVPQLQWRSRGHTVVLVYCSVRKQVGLVCLSTVGDAEKLAPVAREQEHWELI